MLNNILALTHEQQQQAVERLQALMAGGMSSGEAIALVSRELRANHTGEKVILCWDDEDFARKPDASTVHPMEDLYDDNPDDE